ncbi:HlyD family type I secretion periplasmic adaptor subunit [Bradyrhizobium sp. WYCCWR 13023]|uniref:Membrane fusion protein (MFP) family protein n=1 Tax=Bradyrhizobium zhengyangense TaxID=2911009 RepID=A0A9X1RLC8_9BRAD|nr:HlyD family type I secretion periplasmic adaptor subunit [Bradyrhizobium zhengyangense]MCG2632350.1 HlyD family type I secretion periplasmic adaptor subunit [Bradyrhizobium zhengyangense]MCG2672782.1 HlyD family type I secretion periplasmic adaptor subunit [Bradyrhizobium zhengyangense]
MKFADANGRPVAAPRTRGRIERAFLPAALEIIESPPPPLAGAIGGTIIVLFCLALAWASFAAVDIVASAPGRVIPSGRTKVVQPFETGVVRAIHVRDGQTVKAGELLIELDPTINAAERDHLQGDLFAATLDVARLSALLTDDPLGSFRPPLNVSGPLVASQRQLLSQQAEEHRAKLASLDSQKAQKQAELKTLLETVAKLEATLPILQQRVEIKSTLYAREVGSKANYLEILQVLTETQHELLVQKSRSHEAEAAVTSITEARAQTAAEFKRTISADLVEAQRKATGLGEDLIKATQRTQLQQLTSPVDGTVQQLSVHTLGGVVTPAQALLVVVPAESRLEIEALVSNRDIGFIQIGQEAEIKVDTFNFTRYGLMHGRVQSVSQDAITQDKPADRSGDATFGAAATTSEPKGKEFLYQARISLDQSQMQIDDRTVNLSPGMAVTVEIKTGKRSVLSYLLSPLLRYKQESLRER